MNELILDKARELGQLIISSDEFTGFKAAEVELEKDSEAKNLISIYNRRREELMVQMAREDIDKEQMESIRNQIVEEFKKMAENQTVKSYVEAAEIFNALVSQMNSIIAFYVKGYSEDGYKSGQNSGCGGCGKSSGCGGCGCH